MALDRLRSHLIGLMALIWAPLSLADMNAWTITGPEGGSVNALAMHPTTPSIVLIGTGRGIYRSTDSGLSWSLLSVETLNGVQDIAFDPVAPNRVIATDGFIYLSTDGGQTFQIAQGPALQNNVSRIAFASDGNLYAICYGGAMFKTASPFATWTPVVTPWPANSGPEVITIDPNNPQVVYVSIYEVGIYRSGNGGNTWSGPLTTGFANPGNTGHYAIAVDPTDSSRVIAGTSAGIHLSTNSGTSWTLVDPSPTGWIGFNPGLPNQVTAFRGAGMIMRSTDRGATWPTLVDDLQTNGLPQGRYFPGSSNHLLMTSDHGVADSIQDGNDYDFRVSGMRTASVPKIVASDQGQIFVAMNAGFGSIFRRDLQANYHRIISAQANGMVGVRQISALSVSAADYNTVFAINSGYQLIRTTNGGGSWSAPHAAFSVGPSADYLLDVKIAPSNAAIAYVGRVVTGVWKTTNGGVTYSALAGSPAFVSTIAVDPTNANVVYVSGGTTDATGIYKTTDGGATWQQKLAPGGSHWIRHFAFDPANAAIVYASSTGGVRKSTNGGDSWSFLNFGGSTGTNVDSAALLIDPLIPTTMIMVGNLAAPGFFRSVDGGATWEQTAFHLPGPVAILQGAVLSLNGEIVAATTSAGVAEYTPAPDLSVSLSGLSATLPRSSTVTSTFTIRNLGPHASSASGLTIALPFFVTPTVPGNCTFAAQILTCEGGVLRVGESRSLAIPLFIGTGSTQGGLSASVLGHEADSAYANNTLVFNFDTVELADVDVSMTSGTQTIDRGDVTSVSVSAGNSGPSPSTNTRLNVQISANLAVENLVASAGAACVQTASTIECSPGTLASGATVNLTFNVRGTGAGASSLFAEIHGNGTDPDSAHTASRAIAVRPVSDVGVTLVESADPVTVGVPFQYIATVRNNGDDAGSIQLSVPVTSAIVTAVSATEGTCTFTAGSVSCTLAPLPSASSTVTIDVNSAAPGIATATATAVFAGTDPVSTNNSATIGTTLRLVGDVSVEIAGAPDPATVNAPFTYTVTVRNAGPNAGAVHVVVPVTNATVTGALSSAATCTVTASTATCDIGSLANGASATLAIIATAAAPATASATATATFIGIETNAANDSATASTTVRLVGDIAVEIADSADPVLIGGALNYTATVRNLGPNTGAVHLVVNVTGGTAGVATPSAGGTCTTGNSNTRVECDFASLASGASGTATFGLTTTTAGTATAAATATFAGTDLVATNDLATASTTVNTPPSSSSGGGSSGGGGGGGGGRFDWLALMLLGGLAAIRGRHVIFAR